MEVYELGPWYTLIWDHAENTPVSVCADKIWREGDKVKGKVELCIANRGCKGRRLETMFFLYIFFLGLPGINGDLGNTTGGITV
jgi:hypothetical protein